MPDRWPVHTLIFDLDDTLYPERDFVLSGFAAAGAWLQREHGIAGFSAKVTELFLAGRRGHIFDEALHSLGVTASVPELVRVYRLHTPMLRLSDETRQVLDWAKSGFRLAVVSDGYLEVQRRKAEALGLRQWIEHIVFSDEWGRDAWKPSCRPFEEVMRRLPGTTAGFVYIGDNPRKDFIAPRTMGWRSIRLRLPGGEHAAYEPTEIEKAEHDVASLAELRDLLAPA